MDQQRGIFFRIFSSGNVFCDSSSCKLILEEQILQNSHDVEAENEMNECKKLQVNKVLMQN